MPVLPIGRCKIMRSPPLSEDLNTGEWKVAFKKRKRGYELIIKGNIDDNLKNVSGQVETNIMSSGSQIHSRRRDSRQFRWPSTGLMISIHLLLVVCLSRSLQVSGAAASVTEAEEQAKSSSLTTTPTTTATPVPYRQFNEDSISSTTETRSSPIHTTTTGASVRIVDDGDDDLPSFSEADSITLAPRVASSTSSAFDDFVSSGPESSGGGDSMNQLQTPTMSTTTTTAELELPTNITSTPATNSLMVASNQNLDEHPSADFSSVDDRASGNQLPFPSASVILEHEPIAASTVESLLSGGPVTMASDLVDVSENEDNDQIATTIVPQLLAAQKIAEHNGEEATSLDADTVYLAPSAEEKSTSQLIRSRKSPDNETRSMDSSSAMNRQQTIVTTKLSTVNSTLDQKPPPLAEVITGSGGNNLSPFNNLDYDDFDLDYQLKLNASVDSLMTTPPTGQGLNKRDQDGLNSGIKPPAWSALVMQQPHVFTPSPSVVGPAAVTTGSTVNVSATGSGNSTRDNSQPMLPPLLTVHSTQLTNQELQKIRPQFLFYQDNYDQSYAGDLQSGDLLATASGGGLPATTFAVVAMNGSQVSLAPLNATGRDHISLMNGSPVMRQNMLNMISLRNNSNNNKTFSGTEMPIDSSTVTTIVVDNLAPTELPPTAPATHSSGVITSTFATPTSSGGSATTSGSTGETSATTTTTTSAPKANLAPSNTSGQSQSNQWFNYPHPNLHHNPLLLHHILNKPSAYTQQMASSPTNQQQPPRTNETPTSTGSSPNPFNLFQQSTLSPVVTSTTAATPMQSPAATTSPQSPPTTTFVPTSTNSPPHLNSVVNIIEKPALVNEFIQRQPISVNRTQLQMQLNEMRALASAAKLQKPATLGTLATSSNQQPNAKLVVQPVVPQQPSVWRAPPQLPPRQPLAQMAPPFAVPEQQSMIPMFQFPVGTPHQQQQQQSLTQVNVLHHLLGHNLYDGRNPIGHQLQLQPAPPPPPPTTTTTSNKKLIHSVVFGPNRPNPTQITKVPPIPMFSGQATQLHVAPLRPLREPASGLHSSQVVAAPSLMQQVYTPRPASMLPNGTNLYPVAPLPSPLKQSQINLTGPARELYKLLGIGGQPALTSGKLMMPSFDANEAASSPISSQITMSDEDMSTYVSQLASLGANNPPPTSSGVGTDLVRFFESFLKDKENSQRQQQQQHQIQMDQILKQAKLVGLPDEVQAQIYQDLNMQPPLGVASTTKSTKTNWHQSRPSAESSSLMSSFHPPSAGFDLGNNISYHSIDGHQEQQKREREQLIAAILAAGRPADPQKLKQSAFIEALKTSVSKLQQQAAAAGISPEASSSLPTTASGKLNPKLMANGDWSSLAGTEYSMLGANSSGQSTDFDDTISGRPIPEWLERQIMQDSFVHESARVHPFGQTTKSTYIGPAPLPPSSSIFGSLAAHHGRPASTSIRLTPLSPSSAHLLTAASHNVRPIFQAPGAAPLTSHYSLSPAPPRIHLHALGSGARARFHHHHHLGHHHHSGRFSPAALMDASHTIPAPQMLAPPSLAHPLPALQQVNPVKILSDRFPLTSAPAYLVKLPTLTGGTITASGSLQPPFSRFNRFNRPPMGLPPFVRFLSGAPPPSGFNMNSNMPQVYQAPQRIRLVPAQSVQTLAHAVPSMAHHVHPYHLPVPASSSLISPSHHNHGLTSTTTYHTIHHPPPSASQYTQLYPLNHRMPTNLASSATPHNHQPSSGDATHSASTMSSVHPTLEPGAPASTATSGQNAHVTSGHYHHQLPATDSQPASPATAALSRLQQATASLVELTSLASLVEEMVSGNDIETSPAAALANAINSLSAAQNAALSAQASSTSGASVGNSGTNNGAGSASGGDTSGQYNSNSNSNSNYHNNNQQAYHQPLAGGPSFWRNLLNPAIWGRDKTLLKQKDFSAIERFIAQAARRPPAARLKVKYIRVPVAVYETSNGQQLGDVTDPRNPLVTKSQLAELVATSQHIGGQSGGGSSQPGVTFDGTTTTATATTHPQATGVGPLSATSISSILGHHHQASGSGSLTGTSAPTIATNGQQGQALSSTSGSTGSNAAASSNDYLFDEISSDSVPQLALALRDHYLAQQVAASESSLVAPDLLPFLNSAAYSKSNHHQASNGMSSLESGQYYSLAAPSSLLKSQLMAEESETKSEKTSGTKKRKKKKKKQNEDDDEEDEEEDDDDDLLSSKDLPVIESIISTLVHGPHGPQLAQQAPAAPASGLSSLFSRSRGSPFASASNQVASFAPANAVAASSSSHSILNPFSKHTPKFSIGEVVGALGARKIISSILNKRKSQTIVTGKRVSHLTSRNSNSRQSTPSSLDSDSDSAESTTTETPFGGFISTKKFPTIAAYESIKTTTTTRRPLNNGNKFYKPSSVLASTPTTTSTMATPRLEKAHDIITSSLTNRTNAMSMADTTTIPPMTIFESTRGEPSFLNKRSNSRGPPNRSVKSDGHEHQAEQQSVQFKFILKDHHQPPAKSVSNYVPPLPQPSAGHKQMAMPLYHVVADHYNKLHSGPQQPPTLRPTTPATLALASN